MTAYTPVAVGHGGLDLDASAAAPTLSGNTCQGGFGICLYVKNAAGGSTTVTLYYTPTAPTDGLAVASRAVTVPPGHAMLIPLQDAYEDPATGLVRFDFSAVTSVTCYAVRVGS